MKTVTQKEIQKSILDVFVEVDAICKEQGINYWAAYGTLIGAVRHKGFIPWDDDLDICMARHDYENFIFFMRNNYKGNLYIDTFEDNKSYPYYITRIVGNSLKFVFDDYNYVSGPFIDIYPIDGMGNYNDRKYWERKRWYIDLIRKGLAYSKSKKLLLGNSFLRQLIKLPIIIMSKLLGTSFFWFQIDKLSKKFTWEESNYVGLPVWANKFYFHQKRYFDKTVRVPFENCYINIPYDYDSILREIYGDYWELPSKDKRVPQHGYKVYNKI